MIIFFRIALVFTIVTITWLALTPSPPQTATLGWDKGNHLAAFFVLAFLSDYAFADRASRLSLLPWVCLACYGVGIEVVQWLLQFRFFELNDIVADLVGITLYVVTAPLTLKYIPLLAGLKLGN